MGDEGAAEHPLCLLGRVRHRLRDAHAALLAGARLLEPALAAAAGVDLRLDHPDRPVELARRVFASSAFSTTRPSETGNPYSFSSCLAWYS